MSQTGSNDRVQRLTRDGRHLATIGTPWQRRRRAEAAVRSWRGSNGYVFVADWGNERVQVFTPEGQHFATLIGDAELSTWAREFLDSRQDLRDQRALVDDMDVEKRFWGPTAVKIDAEGRILILDSCRYRVQVYRWADAD